MNQEDIREVITVKEVSKILKMTEPAIRALLRKGKLEGFKLDSRYRIYLDTLPNYIGKK